MWWMIGTILGLLVFVPLIALCIAASGDNNEEDNVWDFDRREP